MDNVTYRAQEIKREYIRRKKVVCGSTWKLASRYHGTDYWTKAAEFSVACDISPDDLLEIAFAKCPAKGGPLPNMLYGNLMRNWFLDWTHSVQKSEGLQALAEPISDEPGSDDVYQGETFFVNPSTEQQFLADFMGAKQVIRRCAGLTREQQIDYRDPQVLEVLRDWISMVPVWLRPLLAVPVCDPIVMERHGRPCQEFLNSRPRYAEAAARAHLPVKEVLQWKMYQS